MVAPGVSVIAARVPNGYADERNPTARVGARFAKASGTSQAAAVVAGEAALLIQSSPKLTPDHVKHRLRAAAVWLPSTEAKYQGRGLTKVNTSRSMPNGTTQSGVWGNGTGSLEAARGSSHVYDGVSELRGEIDIFGRAWDPVAWARASASRTAWVGGNWRGWTWSGNGWNARTWRGVTWSSGTWSARTWREADLASSSWTSRTWF